MANKPTQNSIPLGRKQRVDNADFLRLARDIESYITREEIAAKAQRAAEEIQATGQNRRAAFAWSGGKDSLALQGVCRLAGIEPCVIALTHLEYPAFLRWVTDNMPQGLTVIN